MNLPYLTLWTSARVLLITFYLSRRNSLNRQEYMNDGGFSYFKVVIKENAPQLKYAHLSFCLSWKAK